MLGVTLFVRLSSKIEVGWKDLIVISSPLSLLNVFGGEIKDKCWFIAFSKIVAFFKNLSKPINESDWAISFVNLFKSSLTFNKFILIVFMPALGSSKIVSISFTTFFKTFIDWENISFGVWILL